MFFLVFFWKPQSVGNAPRKTWQDSRCCFFGERRIRRSVLVKPMGLAACPWMATIKALSSWWFSTDFLISILGKWSNLTIRITGSQNRWFGDPRPLLYTSKALYRRVQWFLGYLVYSTPFENWWQIGGKNSTPFENLSSVVFGCFWWTLLSGKKNSGETSWRRWGAAKCR